jgi:hypothetical protein
MSDNKPEVNEGGRVERMEQTLMRILDDVSATKKSTERIGSDFDKFRAEIMGNERTGSRGLVWRLRHLENKVQIHDKRLTKIEKLVYGILLVAGSVTVIVQILLYIKA